MTVFRHHGVLYREIDSAIVPYFAIRDGFPVEVVRYMAVWVEEVGPKHADSSLHYDSRTRSRG